MSSIDGKISCDRCGEHHYERSMVTVDDENLVCIGCWDDLEELENQDSVSFLDGLSDEELAMQPNAPEDETFVANEGIFFPCDECGTMTADHMLASINTDTGMRNCCPMCYSECYEDPRNISTEYTINYLEVIKHEVKVTAMSRAQAERIVLSGNKPFHLRTTRLPQTIGKSIVMES